MKFELPKAYSAEEFVSTMIEGPAYSLSFLNSFVVPRPIAFVTTKSQENIINAAPFSYFNIVCTNPPILSLAIEKRKGERKDTAKNILHTKEFVINVCSVEFAKTITVASCDFPPHVSEAEYLNLTLLPSKKISVPRVAHTLIQMECTFYKLVEIGNDPTDLLLGEVVYTHTHQSLLNENGRIDIKKLNPLARLSGPSYAALSSDFFEIPREMQ